MTITPDVSDPATVVEVAGQQVTLPVEVRSATQASASWVCDADRAQAIVDPTGLRVARYAGNRTMLSLAVVRYLDNDLGPYHELAVAFAVEPHDRPGHRPSLRTPSTYIHRLPVNQEFTCAAGRGIWGFPKWVCTLDLVERAGSITMTVIDDDRIVLAVRVSTRGIRVPDGETTMTAYSFGDGVLRSTPWTNRTSAMRLGPGGAQLSLGTGHPMADELRSLQLSRRPVMHTSTSQMAATFGPAAVVSPV